MIAARIESKKGILEVAEVCKELGYTLILVGSISDREYFDKLMATGVVDFRENISDEDLVKSYHEASVFVCNSVDNFESGPNPVLEAMACGVPVLTREVGHIPELSNDHNMIVRKGEVEDKEDLETELKRLMESQELRNDIRDRAWKTVKTRDNFRRAYQYEKLYWEILSDKPLVSVIVPTFNRKEILARVIEGIILQDWPAVELIIADDGSTDGTDKMIQQLRWGLVDKTRIPIKYLNTGTTDVYNLAYARNLGVIESVGKILVFIDDRYYIQSNFVSEMVKNLHEKEWVYGNKGTKKDFVENISCIYRQDLINAGMFNQSVPLYGFQSQELRVRFKRQGFKFKYIEKAKVETLCSTKNKYIKMGEILRAKNILWKLDID